MKFSPFFIIVLAIIGTADSCKQRSSQKGSLNSEVTPGWSVMLNEPQEDEVPVQASEAIGDTIPDYFPVFREWKELAKDVHYGVGPTATEVTQWKRDFESVNSADSVWYATLFHFKDMGHYVAVQDFIELLHGPQCDKFHANDNRLLWRLDQFDPLIEQKPQAGFEKIRFIRDQYERILDYEPGSQLDMTFWAWLSTDFRDLYGRTLENVIISSISPSASKEIRQEFKCENSYYWASSNAFQMIEGSPVWSGSSFPYRTGCYGIPNIDMGNRAKENLLHALLDSSFLTENEHLIISPTVINQEYNVFASTLEDDAEYTYSLKEQKDALEKDRRAFFKWMDARKAVSAKLSGTIKVVYDNASQSIMRKKLILLKNRFNIDDGFCQDYIVKHLLTEKSSDEELLNHNLEELLKNE